MKGKIPVVLILTAATNVYVTLGIKTLRQRVLVSKIFKHLCILFLSITIQ